jgi:hypothetical protein
MAYSTLGEGNMIWTVIFKTLCGKPDSRVTLGPPSSAKCWNLANQKYNKLIAIIPGNHQVYIKNGS